MVRNLKTRRKRRRRKRGGGGKPGNKIPKKKTTLKRRSAFLNLASPAYRRLSGNIDKSTKRKILIEHVHKGAKDRGLIIPRTQISSDLKTLPSAQQYHHSHLLDVYLQQAEQDKERGQARSNKATRGGRRRRRKRRTRKRHSG